MSDGFDAPTGLADGLHDIGNVVFGVADGHDEFVARYLGLP